MENLMGKSTAILLILLAFGPNKGEPDPKTAEQMPPAAEKQIQSSSSPAAAAELKTLAREPSAEVAPANPSTAQRKQQEPTPDAGKVDLDESPSVAKNL
jgi:hypothetical protein